LRTLKRSRYVQSEIAFFSALNIGNTHFLLDGEVICCLRTAEIHAARLRAAWI